MSYDQVITLTTDFGYDDPFVGVMKGVILSINPRAKIVDLTHGIRPHDIREAAFTIGMNFDFFPKHSTHIVVTDPGVGSARRPLLIMMDHHYFVGPDNGVFSFVYSRKKEWMRVYHITAGHYFLSERSPTFQARDVFAPIAAYFSRGISMEKFGEIITDYITIPLPVPMFPDEETVSGEVILIDRFGNAMANIQLSDIEKLRIGHGAGILRVMINGNEVPLKNYYAEAEDGKLCSLINSSGYLEFFVNKGNAADNYHIMIGDTAEVVLAG